MKKVNWISWVLVIVPALMVIIDIYREKYLFMLVWLVLLAINGYGLYQKIKDTDSESNTDSEKSENNSEKWKKFLMKIGHLR